MRVTLGIALAGSLAFTARPFDRRQADDPPAIIMFYSDTMKAPVFLTDTAENGRFMRAVSGIGRATAAELERRPRLEVALFGPTPRWRRVARDTALLRRLRPEDAERHARLYPPAEGLGGLFVSGTAEPPVIRRIDLDGLRILRRYGLALHLE